jgi:hypothetical protein
LRQGDYSDDASIGSKQSVKLPYFHIQPSRFTAWRLFVFFATRSPLPEIALVLVRLDHVADRIVNANHSAV